MAVYMDGDFRPIAPFFFDETAGCPVCDEDLYDHGCSAPGHTGYGCMDCGWGCDVDYAPAGQGRCVRAMAAADDDGAA